VPTLSIRIDGVDSVLAEYADINANQLPYAVVLSLTRTAQQAQDTIRNTVLPTRFTLRRAAFIKQGVRIQAATKTKLAATVQDIDYFMALQETGGQKIPYGKYIAVPLSGARPTLTAIVNPANYPAAVMQRGGFIRGNIMYAVAFKAGRRGRLSGGIAGLSKAADWSRQIIPMYALVERANVPARYGFEESVRGTVAESWLPNFQASFLQAVRTAKR
jgi:hypothetical protein